MPAMDEMLAAGENSSSLEEMHYDQGEERYSYVAYKTVNVYVLVLQKCRRDRSINN